jgi:GNAT superfamily N-acetyltransferase
MQLYDLPHAATVSANAFKTDSNCNCLFPRLHDYPDDFRNFFLRRHRKRLNQSGVVARVAVIDDHDPLEEGTVIGVAIWERLGDSEVAQAWKCRNQGLGLAIEYGLLYLGELYFNIFVGNRSADEKHVAAFFASIEDNFPRETINECWYLRHLAVDPAYQRRGAGQLLTKWGIEKARREGCCAILETSPQGQPMYEKLGFQVIKTITGNKVTGILPMPILVWQPENCPEDWVGQARQAAEKQKQKEEGYRS